MKNIKLLSVITVAVIMLSGCSKNNEDSRLFSTDDLLKSPLNNVYEQIAIEHNQGLYYCLLKMEENPSYANYTSEEKKKFLQKAIIDYMFQESSFASEIGDTSEIVSIINDSYYIVESFANTTNTRFSTIVDTTVFSPVNKEKSCQLNQIIKNYDYSNGITDLCTQLNNFIDSMSTNRTQTGGSELLVGAYIGLYSANYWNENILQWEEVGGISNVKWWKVVLADVAGGAAGYIQSGGNIVTTIITAVVASANLCIQS